MIMEQIIEKKTIPLSDLIDISKYPKETIEKLYEENDIINKEIDKLGIRNHFKNGYKDIDLNKLYVYKSNNNFNSINSLINHLYNINILYYKLEGEDFNYVNLKETTYTNLDDENYTNITSLFVNDYFNVDTVIQIQKVIYLKYLKLRLHNNLYSFSSNLLFEHLYLDIPNNYGIKIPMYDCKISLSNYNYDTFNLNFNINTNYLHSLEEGQDFDDEYIDTYIVCDDLDNLDLDNLFVIDYEKAIEVISDKLTESLYDSINKDKIIKLLEAYYLGEYSINSKNSYDEIVIRFKEFEISNSKNNKHNIKDFFLSFKINKNYDKFNTSVLHGARTSYTLEEFESGYTHSHENIPSFNMWGNMCLGSTVLSQFMIMFLEKIEDELFESFLIQLNNYVRWESLEGVPYRYIRNINLKNNTNSYNREIDRMYDYDFQLKIYNFILTTNPKAINIKESSFENINRIILEPSIMLEKCMALYIKNVYYKNKLNNLDLNILNVFSIKDCISGEYISLLSLINDKNNNACQRELDLIKGYDNTATDVIFNGSFVKSKIIKKYSLNNNFNDFKTINDILELNKESLVVNNCIYESFLLHIENKLNRSFIEMNINKLKKEYYKNYDNNIK